MRLAISNIAWDVQEDQEVANLLRKFNVDAIDIAPGKYFSEPANATKVDIKRVKHWWLDRGIKITGMQALLFGTNGLNIFGSQDIQNALLAHMATICRIGSELGATRLVFGSPKNRDRSGLSDEQALKEAVNFFRRLGDIAFAQGVVICLEPNPKSYGANFMTMSAETANVVRCVDHPAILKHLDTGSITINAESIKTVLAECSHLIGHIHASEPNLVPLGDLNTDHNTLCDTIMSYLPNHVVSIEMLATKNEPHLVSIERALAFAVQHYRPIKGAPV
ncbi:sugar phosphate isomerase/epimerase family protein [Spirobacillus cienkowskii]|uniref:sugar phosphate isomerase/epimerase family protein n=1 Tax=Spirobacillus cienkowskii TaxID=495820 RepID=UPI0030CBF452